MCKMNGSRQSAGMAQDRRERLLELACFHHLLGVGRSRVWQDVHQAPRRAWRADVRSPAADRLKESALAAVLRDMALDDRRTSLRNSG
jgi:hypothetical protein